MGIENSIQEKNNILRKIGQEANKKDPKEFQSVTPIKINIHNLTPFSDK